MAHVELKYPRASPCGAIPAGRECARARAVCVGLTCSGGHVVRPVFRVLVDVEPTNRLVDGVQDGAAVLGEQVAVDVLCRLDFAVAHLMPTCMSVAPEAISSEAQTCRSSWAV